MRELPQVAFKGKILNNSSHHSAKSIPSTIWQLLELERQVGVYYKEGRNPSF